MWVFLLNASVAESDIDTLGVIGFQRICEACWFCQVEMNIFSPRLYFQARISSKYLGNNCINTMTGALWWS